MAYHREPADKPFDYIGDDKPERDYFLEEIIKRIEKIWGDKFKETFQGGYNGNPRYVQAWWSNRKERLLRIQLETTYCPPITLIDLWALSEALGTTDISFQPGGYQHGMSEYTPSWYEEGVLYIRNPVV